jgi:transcriptional regulator with XRE-family HTH domain
MKQRTSGQVITEYEYSELLKCLGKRIRKLRKERGLTLRQMEIIHGRRDPDWRRLERAGAGNMALLLRVARGFKISLSTLLRGLEQCAGQEDKDKQ